MKKSTLVHAFVGFIVGLGGGLVGLGGAELRLPYLVGSLKLPVKTAIPINLAISLLTILAALPARLYTLSVAGLKPFIYETAALGFGAALGSYLGVSLVKTRFATCPGALGFCIVAGAGHRDAGRIHCDLHSTRPDLANVDSAASFGTLPGIGDRRDQRASGCCRRRDDHSDFDSWLRSTH